MTHPDAPTRPPQTPPPWGGELTATALAMALVLLLLAWPCLAFGIGLAIEGAL